MSEFGRDPETGQRYVRADENSPWVPAPSGRAEAFGQGVAEGAMDLMLAPTIPLDLLGGLASGLGAESTGQAISGGADYLRNTRLQLENPEFQGAQEAYPFTSFGGLATGSLFPGRLGVQAGLGGLIEGGRGSTITEQASGAALGVGGAVAGDLLGELVQRRLSRTFQRRQGELQRERADAAEALQGMGVELPERAFAREGARGPELRDRLDQLLHPGASVRARRRSLNRVMSSILTPDDVVNGFSARWRGKMFEEVNSRYATVRGMLPEVIEQSEDGDQVIIEMLSLGDQILPANRPNIDFLTDRIAKAYEAGQITPDWWSSMRSNIAAAARSAPDHETAKAVYQVRNALDELVMADNQQVRQALTEANDLWMINEVMNRPNVISPQRELNPTAFIRNMEDMFGQPFNPAVRMPERARTLYELADNIRLFPDFQTSGTGEMLTAGSISRQLSARSQRAVGSLGSIIGGSVGRAAAKTAEGIQQGLEPVFSLFDDGDQEEEENNRP